MKRRKKGRKEKGRQRVVRVGKESNKSKSEGDKRRKEKIKGEEVSRQLSSQRRRREN